VLRTWVRDDGRYYEPWREPALWRRVADLPTWQAAQREYGPLSILPVAGLDDWPTLHPRLIAAAGLWKPRTADDVYRLSADRAAVRNHPDVQWVYYSLLQEDIKQQRVVALDPSSWQSEVKSESLRAELLSSCIAAIGSDERYRRCDHCSRWFATYRTDAMYCAAKCKQAAHAARLATV
jgi:hypothetical protein